MNHHFSKKTAMSSILQRFQKACDTFVQREKSNPDVIGIIVAGSFIYGQIDPNSDIDIFIILNPTCDYRERGNTWVNDVEIEYFKNPPQQILSYFEKEKNSPHTAHMIANGQIVFQNSPIIDELRTQAQTILKTPPPPIKDIEVNLGKYVLDDMFKDLEDVILKNDLFAIPMVHHGIINKCIDLFCKKNQIKRMKYKRLESQLASIDPHFVEILKSTFRPDWQKNQSMENLKIFMANMLGGERSKEWILKSGLDL